MSTSLRRSNVLRFLPAAVLAGVALGVAGRLLMRLIAIEAGMSAAYSTGGSLEVVAFGVLAGCSRGDYLLARATAHTAATPARRSGSWRRNDVCPQPAASAVRSFGPRGNRRLAIDYTAGISGAVHRLGNYGGYGSALGLAG